ELSRLLSDELPPHLDPKESRIVEEEFRTLLSSLDSPLSQPPRPPQKEPAVEETGAEDDGAAAIQAAEMASNHAQLEQRFKMLDRKMSTNQEELQRIAHRQSMLGGHLFEKSAQTPEWQQLAEEKKKLLRENMSLRRRLDDLLRS
ncbi:MAG: hypothetical protein Q8P67_13800, partial [archaeon]|nr:hypothetical protein [archaeon]